jgi:hypothetical protein
MEEKLNTIAQLLGGKLMPGHGANTWFIVMGDPTQWETLKLLVHKPYGQAQDMWRVSYYAGTAAWKDGKFSETSYHYHEGQNLHINVNMTRPIPVLVNDITKRLVIPAEKANVENVAGVKADMDYKAKVLAFGREFGKMGDDDCKVRVYTSSDYRDTVEVSYIGDTHAVLRADLSHDKIRKAVNFIKEIVNEP